ncbi:uncharacterized protein [Ptychodera flava]|uniref:uncharacterized protein n=1 Tax=Ptychodera flava TaxID=63121 RepID=UPI003969F6F7
MSRSPWWGGFFERLIGIMKRSLSKAIGRALLKFEELEEVLLDVETFMNNRPLCYMEEDFEQVVITPNLLLRGQPARFLEESIDDMDDSRDVMSKRLKYLRSCRENDTTKNRANWKIGRIVDNIVGKDGVIRGYKIRTGSGYVVERPLQLVCDLEVSGTNDATGVGTIAEPDADPVLTRHALQLMKRKEIKPTTI